MDNNRFNDNHLEFNRQILEILAAYIEEKPSQRFGQILFNLEINQFKNQDDPDKEKYLLRDIYNDLSEDILNRVKERVEKMNS